MVTIKVFSALLLAFVLLGAPSSHADRGVGINVSRIEVTRSLTQGGGYDLQQFAVINTGDEPAEYEVNIGYLANQAERRPDPTWFEFHPPRFSLQPGEMQNVSMSLSLPSGAETGDYYAQVQAQLVTDAGAPIGVAAAARLSFSVESSSWFAAQRLRINRFLRDLEPWSYFVEGLFVLGLVAYFARRYSPVRPRLRFERRR